EDLRRDNSLDSVGGVIFLTNLTYGLPHVTSIAPYAKVVRGKSLLRQLVKVANKITSEALEEEDEPAIILDHAEHAIFTLADARIFIDDTPAISVLEMRAKARRLATEQKQLDMIVVDYLQLMSGSTKRFESRQQEVSQISRELKALAKELNVPLVALSQLSRAPENRTEHRPQLADLRESGAIEQDADLVAFIYREEQYKRTVENKNIAELIVAKQRNSPTDHVYLAFLNQFAPFADLEKDALGTYLGRFDRSKGSPRIARGDEF